jgi:hypothetical protein
MRAEKIQDHVRKRPFRPLRIHLSDGASYDVLHPDMVVVTRTEVCIGVLRENARDVGEVAERLVYCDPLHVTRIVPIRRRRRSGS